MATNRVIASVALVLMLLIGVQAAVALAAGPDTFAAPQVLAQGVPTPTPFRFVTPTPFSLPSTTTTTPSTTAPRAGGFPVELAIPALAGGLAAIGGGSMLLRRRRS